MFHNNTSIQDGEDDGENNLPWILLVLCLFLLVGSCLGLFSCVGGIPGPEFHFGAIIRQQAEQARAVERRKERRHNYTPDERHQQIQKHLETMIIVERESHTGYYQLAEPEQQQQSQTITNVDGGSVVVDLVEEKKTIMIEKNDDEVDKTQQEKIVRHTNPTLLSCASSTDAVCPIITITSKPSTDDTTDATTVTNLDSDSNSNSDSDFDVESQLDNHTNSNISTEDADDNEDDYVCQICLDRFEMGDTVMFQKQQQQPVEMDRTMTMTMKTKKNESSSSSDSECESISSSFSNKKKLGSSSSSNSNSKSNSSRSCCGHFFHQECIMEWLFEKRENECPSCRAIFIHTEDDDEDDDDKSQPQQQGSNLNDGDVGAVDTVDENNGDVAVDDNNGELSISIDVDDEKKKNDTISNDDDDTALALALELEVDIETGIIPTTNTEDSIDISGDNKDADHRSCQEDREIHSNHIANQNNSNYGNATDNDTDNDIDKANGTNGVTYYIAKGRIRLLVR